MELRFERDGFALVVSVSGRLDGDTSRDFLDAMDLTLGQTGVGADAGFVLLDLSNVTYVSSAGLSAMLAVAGSVDARLGVCALRPTVSPVFDASGLSRLFGVYDDRFQALAVAAAPLV